MPSHERFTTAVNDSTGDLIKTKASNQQAYADNWERIFQKPKDSAPKAEQALSRLVDDGVLTDNVTRRHEEQNIGKGLVLADPVAVWKEEHITRPFVAEELPEGLIEDEE